MPARLRPWLSLPHRFEKGDDCSHGDVEGISLAGHRNANLFVAGIQPGFAEPKLLTSHDNRKWPRQVAG